MEKDRKVVFYYSWSLPAETSAPLQVIENRFPALFESRRMLYPAHRELADPARVDQGIAGFLEQILKENFRLFAEYVLAETGNPLTELERVRIDGEETRLSDRMLQQADTVIVIGFDSLRTRQEAGEEEVQSVQRFLADPGHILFVCPHHDIDDELSGLSSQASEYRIAAFQHHGDRMIPPQQGFGGFGRSLLAGLGVPVHNQFGLRPAHNTDGTAAAVDIVRSLDHLHLLDGVVTFNLHPHLPHFERSGEASSRLDVLARQRIDLTAPPHPAIRDGRTTFDAFLQSRPGVFAGSLVVCDATLWSGSAGGLSSLRRFWSNVLQRSPRSGLNAPTNKSPRLGQVQV